MKCLLIGDPHFRKDNALESDKFVNEVYRVLDENKDLDCVIILGDVLDRHEIIDMLPLYRAHKFILELRKRILTFVIIGNHDRINNDVFLTDIHPFVGLKDYTNLYIIDEPFVYENCLFVPYVSNGRFKEAIGNISLENIKVVFCHQEFRGCKMGAIESRDGDVWESDIPVFSGHIHQFQEIGNICYVGTPFQHGFSDMSEKAILKIDVNNL